MGKRSDFERAGRDFYETPAEAVRPLINRIGNARRWRFCEPCAGAGALVRHLEAAGLECVQQSDIHPLTDGVQKMDALGADFTVADQADFIITNPPWKRDWLHPMIDRFSRLKPCWLLFDADWMHTEQAADLMRCCREIVSVGRVKWFEGTGHKGKENCAWFLFDQTGPDARGLSFTPVATGPRTYWRSET